MMLKSCVALVVQITTSACMTFSDNFEWLDQGKYLCCQLRFLGRIHFLLKLDVHTFYLLQNSAGT